MRIKILFNGSRCTAYSSYVLLFVIHFWDRGAFCWLKLNEDNFYWFISFKFSISSQIIECSRTLLIRDHLSFVYISVASMPLSWAIGLSRMRVSHNKKKTNAKLSKMVFWRCIGGKKPAFNRQSFKVKLKK
jgi:hypothetical protein